MELEYKIEYEYESFYLDQMRTSRENIFARSGEIETKKRLTNELYQVAVTVDEKTKQLLCVQVNLLESFYRYYMDEVRKRPHAEMQIVREKWIASLTKNMQMGDTKKGLRETP